METYTIKGLYLNNGKNPTYYGTLEGAMRYANGTHNFIHRGENIEICIGDTIKARQVWEKKTDELGDYWEPHQWLRVY